MRKGLNSYGAMHRRGPPANPDSLCGNSHPNEQRGVEDFVTLVEKGHPQVKPCERCLLMYQIAVANNIPIRHQNLDQVVNKLLAEQLK
jgi:hypothetical protein